MAITGLIMLGVILLVILILFVALAILQVYLSKSDSKVSGLILPIIFFIISIILSVPNFINSFHIHFSAGAFSSSCLFVLIYNIPTICYLLIYFYQKNKIKRNSQLNKMNIQDL